MAQGKDKRQRTDAQKAQSRQGWIAAGAQRRRVKIWTAAATAATAAGCPLNTALHVTWGALHVGERLPGHCLGLPAVERERRLWAALQLVAARAGVPWLAARGPEYDRRRGLHLHIAMHLPDAAAMRDALAAVERVTGAPAEWADMAGRTVHGHGRRHHGVVALSSCHGWLLHHHVAGPGGSAVTLAAYAAKGDGSARVDGQHRLSNALSSLARQAEMPRRDDMAVTERARGPSARVGVPKTDTRPHGCPAASYGA